ncbi:MAG: thermonuclease family protein [Phycisphaerae bacterium]|nr:thermonuclease family protein [Phycisphaerae bacterium]
MKRVVHGLVLLVVVLLALSQYVLRAWQGREPAPQAGPEFSGPVVHVADGDTIEVLHSGRPERIRLNAVDCPEQGQAFGTAARQFTSSLVSGQDVTVRSSGQDQYGRTIGDVLLPDGRSLNQELVRAGMAWWYRAYSNDRVLGDLESEARSERRGLWSDPHPTPPSQWRRQNNPATP